MSVASEYTDRDRIRYLELTDHVSNAWLETFDYDLGFSTAVLRKPMRFFVPACFM